MQRSRLGAYTSYRPIPACWTPYCGSPLLDAGRAREELGWTPSATATEAVAAFLEGLHQGTGLDTPPLTRRAA
ncbi:hypothetical protein OG594_45270 [Streptomyces sp. NBC_01214]|uniref:hypothetical protein n=1 Tax=Streptomyces sp. NBC_01214 TaxID=2903777 RepID=UPI0022595868|nr:hypothetical protein [Streptomyces sp. NBC_01214]MCX4808698.1 hypothetical protein [Streptomyces sp. NBC_01214]